MQILFSKNSTMSVEERVVLGEKLIFGFKRSDYFTERVQRLIASPEYRQRSKDTEQPEAFPGSGIATNVIEYLAESKNTISVAIPFILARFSRRCGIRCLVKANDES